MKLIPVSPADFYPSDFGVLRYLPNLLWKFLRLFPIGSIFTGRWKNTPIFLQSQSDWSIDSYAYGLKRKFNIVQLFFLPAFLLLFFFTREQKYSQWKTGFAVPSRICLTTNYFKMIYLDVTPHSVKETNTSYVPYICRIAVCRNCNWTKKNRKQNKYFNLKNMEIYRSSETQNINDSLET